MSDYDSWSDLERIAVNVNTLYREYSQSNEETDVAALFGLMAKLHKNRR